MTVSPTATAFTSLIHLLAALCCPLPSWLAATSKSRDVEPLLSSSLTGSWWQRSVLLVGRTQRPGHVGASNVLASNKSSKCMRVPIRWRALDGTQSSLPQRPRHPGTV